MAVAYDPYVKEKTANEPDNVFNRCQEFPSNFSKAVADVLKYRTIDSEYKDYVSLMILKLYNCQFNYGGLGRAVLHAPWDRLWTFNPLYRAYIYIYWISLSNI